jgi:hypothetical protein
MINNRQSPRYEKKKRKKRERMRERERAHCCKLKVHEFWNLTQDPYL